MTALPLDRSDAWIDECGLLRVGSRWAALPDIEWRLVELLLERVGRLVRRDDLIVAGWRGREVADSALSVHIRRVRRRVEPLGLRITTVRGRGYVLDHAFD